MSMRRIMSFAAVAALGVGFVSADAFAARVAARGGGVANRGAVMGARGGAVAYRGGLGYRGGLAYRGGLYGGGYYRPGLGLAAGAVVGGAIAASQPWYGYGAYDAGYGYSPGYARSYYPSTNGYPYAGPVSYGYDSGYAAGNYAAVNGYGPYDYGYAPGYLQTCTYVSGPKAMDWACR